MSWRGEERDQERSRPVATSYHGRKTNRHTLRSPRVPGTVRAVAAKLHIK